MDSNGREAVVEVRDVSTRFGAAVVHDRISLTVYRGEIFAVVGASGSGKSMLLREIIMLRRPDAGSIRLLGREVTTLHETDALDLKRRIGVLFQHGALFSALTVAENIAVPLREHTRLSADFIREIVAIKLDWVRFPRDSVHKYPSELSGGMLKRAALARAIALDPELIFLDEPTAGLDPASASALDELIRQLKSILGLTVVMVTHDLDSLWQVADRVGVLGDGRILQVGTMEELSRSDHPAVAEYFRGVRGRAAREQAWNQR
ncbi:MAG TPA: ATP-binding cassette domain-containing protein [candidate division Zixibacteria bacterium]|nr:ATP-binding cassette domain-containing protein [candidate division Zixibacteria bacterium]